MADEPLLFFDGDNAGRRAAYRALDMALPKLLPGKSLKFALLPEGQDPDDLARSGGREAIAEVLDSARSLSDMLWQRETESAPLDTPERQAALGSARRRDDRARSATKPCGVITATICRRGCARCSRRPMPRPRFRASARSTGAAGKVVTFGRDWKRGGRSFQRDAFAQPSVRLASSQMIRGSKSAMPSREALSSWP
jgi:DNA primase